MLPGQQINIKPLLQSQPKTHSKSQFEEDGATPLSLRLQQQADSNRGLSSDNSSHIVKVSKKNLSGSGMIQPGEPPKITTPSVDMYR